MVPKPVNLQDQAYVPYNRNKVRTKLRIKPCRSRNLHSRNLASICIPSPFSAIEVNFRQVHLLAMSFSGAFEPMRLRERRDFEFGRQIGDGSYSTVVLAREIENGKEFAVKILDKRHLVKHDKVKCAGVEKDVLNRLNHPFVVKLFYTFQDNVNLYFVLELAKRGDLLGLLRKAGGRFNTEQARFYSAEIFLAMEYMHKTSILHRDIKPENVLIAGDGHIRVRCVDIMNLNQLTLAGSDCGFWNSQRLNASSPSLSWGRQCNFVTKFLRGNCRILQSRAPQRSTRVF